MMIHFPAVRMLVAVGSGFPLYRVLHLWPRCVFILFWLIIVVISVQLLYPHFSAVPERTRSWTAVPLLLGQVLCGILMAAAFTLVQVPSRTLCNFSTEAYAEGYVVATGRSESASWITLHGEVRTQGALVFESSMFLWLDSASAMHIRQGDEVSMHGNIRAPLSANSIFPDERSMCRRHGAELIARPYELAVMKPAEDWQQELGGMMCRIRMANATRIEMLFSAEYQELAKALAIGLDDDIDEDVRQSFIRSGTAHILAVSGMHVSFILVLISTVTGAIRRAAVRRAASLTAVIMFVAISGGQASCIRAGIMALFVEWARSAARRHDSLNVLCATTLGMIAVSPETVVSPGYVLSFAALLGIYLFSARMEHICSMLIRPERGIALIVARTLAMSLAVEVVVSPVSAWLFGGVPLLGAMATLVALPLSLMATCGVFVSLAVSMVSIDLSSMTTAMSQHIMFLMIAFNDAVCAIPGSFQVYTSAIIVAVLSSMCIVYCSMGASRRHVLWRLVVGCVVIVSIVYHCKVDRSMTLASAHREMNILLVSDATAVVSRHDVVSIADRHRGEEYAQRRLLLHLSSAGIDTLVITEAHPCTSSSSITSPVHILYADDELQR